MLSRSRFLLLIFLVVVLSSGCERNRQEPSTPPSEPIQSNSVEQASPVIASVGGEPIRIEAVRLELLRHGADVRGDSKDLASSLLEPLIRRRVLALAAREAGFDQDPQVAEEIYDLLAARFWSRYLGGLEPVAVSDEEVSEYYEENESEFREPERIRGALILLRIAADATDAERQAVHSKAQEIANAVQAEEASFGALARQHSDDARSRERGGDIGWMALGSSRHRLEKPVLEALESLDEPGDIAEPVETRRGLYLVQLTERAESELPPLSVVAPRIRARLLGEKQTARSDQEYAKLRQKYEIELDSEAIENLASRLVAQTGQGPPSFPVAAKPRRGEASE